MSHYFAKAIHPVTKQVEDALFMDDYFGRHQYGIKFEDGRIYRADKVDLPPKPKTTPDKL